MRKIRLISLLLLGCALLAGPKQSQLLVQPRLGADPALVVWTLGRHGAPIHHTIEAIHVHVLQVSAPALERVRKALEQTGLFTFVEKDQVAQAVAIPNDPNFPSQWHLAQIQAPAAWDLSTGSASLPIAVVDSGVDPDHPDLASKILPGWSFLTGSANTVDTMGHGTAVAGAAAAATNNGFGVSGVAWSNPVLPLVVVDASGWASYSNMASAITYAADHGARVVNLSLAGSSNSSTLQSAINYAWNKGTVVFAAAGNYSTSAPYYPAACTNVVAVSSTGASDGFSGFSNYGSWIDVAAPGESILTTSDGGGYGYWSGTSFSSPIAAAAGALALSVRPSLSAAQLVGLLEQSADDLGTPGYDTYYGYGRVNAYNAVLAAQDYAGDTTPPAVTISSPAPSAVVSGTIAVTGAATDNVAVAKVELWIDGALGPSTSSPSFSFNWNTAAVANGEHTLAVKAYDVDGNLGQAAVTVTVSNAAPPPDTQPPVVAIISPAGGSHLATNAKITVSASDNVAVTQVSIYVDGVLVYTGTAAPYRDAWNTKKLAPGSHVITANAWDAAGNMGSAAPVTVYK